MVENQNASNLVILESEVLGRRVYPKKWADPQHDQDPDKRGIIVGIAFEDGAFYYAVKYDNGRMGSGMVSVYIIDPREERSGKPKRL